MAKHALQYLHWTAKEYDEADYYRLNEILSAKEINERIVDPLTLLGR